MANQKKWTVMVWMAGDNDLEDFGNRDIQEMKHVVSNDNLNILIQIDRMSYDKTRRYYVCKETSCLSGSVETYNSNPQDYNFCL